MVKYKTKKFQNKNNFPDSFTVNSRRQRWNRSCLYRKVSDLLLLTQYRNKHKNDSNIYPQLLESHAVWTRGKSGRILHVLHFLVHNRHNVVCLS